MTDDETPRYRVGRHMDANVYEVTPDGDRRMAHAVLDEDGPLIVAALNAYEGGSIVPGSAERPVEVRPRDRSFGSRPRMDMDADDPVAVHRCNQPLKIGTRCVALVLDGQCVGVEPHSCTTTWASNGTQQHVHPGVDHACSNDPDHPGNLHRCRCGHHTTVKP